MILKKDTLISFNNCPTDFDASVSIQRLQCNYENLSDKFKYSTKDFTRQYAHIYAGRLNAAKTRLLKNAKTKWGENTPIYILSELADHEKVKCVVLGTIYKHQELKPSLLKEISEEHQLVPQPPCNHYTSSNDILILEDETQRIRLDGVLDIPSLVTGVTIAVLGHENEQGRFEVEDYCFADPDSVSIGSIPTGDCYLALVSGIQLASTNDMLSVELLTDWITGISGGPAGQAEAAKICRLIIAGNSVGPLSRSEVPDVGSLIETTTLDAVKSFDTICSEVAQSMPIDIMPGEHDPSNHTLPQQPLHSCMMPLATKMRSLKLVSNPYQFNLNGRRILGTAGQPIDNLGRITDNLDAISLLKSTLDWGHLAPSAPDTLPCYPYYQSDPFLIDEAPDVYFAGNQKEYQTNVCRTSSDLKAFERRLTEVLACLQPSTRRWRILLVVVSICTAIGAWLWLTDPATYTLPMTQCLMAHPFFTFSSCFLTLLFFFGIHKKVMAPSIIMTRTRQVLSDFNMSCDETGKLILKPRPTVT